METDREDGEIEIIEIEVFVREDKPIPRGKHYRIRIDKMTYVVTREVITGKEILGLAGKTPDSYNLYQHFRHDRTKIVRPEEQVDLSAHRIERFTTMKIENTEG